MLTLGLNWTEMNWVIPKCRGWPPLMGTTQLCRANLWAFTSCNWNFVSIDQPLSSAPGSHYSTPCFYEFDCSGCKWDHAVSGLLWLALRHLALCPHGSFMGYFMPGFPSFSRLNNIPLYVVITFSVVIPPLMDISVASTSCLFLWLVNFFATPRHMGS